MKSVAPWHNVQSNHYTLQSNTKSRKIPIDENQSMQKKWINQQVDKYVNMYKWISARVI